MTGEVDWLEAPDVDLMPMLVANSDIVSKIANPLWEAGLYKAQLPTAAVRRCALAPRRDEGGGARGLYARRVR